MNWLVSREAFKLTASIAGAEQDPIVDRIIEAVSRGIERAHRRYYIPRTETRLYRWPNRMGVGDVLWLDQDLISVTTLQAKAQDASPTTISSSDYFLEPHSLFQTFGHYNRIEIDLSSTASFESGDTNQRSISVLGSWGYSGDTKSVGTVSSGLASSASATTFVCSDSSLLTGISVGDTLLIESEQIFVSGKAAAALDSILIDGALTANRAEVSITVDTGHGINDGEVIQVDSEKMYVQSSTATVLTVVRAWDGSVLAAHNDDTAVNIFRTLTIERGVNGTTAATHANSTAISKYEPESDIVQLAMAETIAQYHQEQAGWGRTVGQGDGAREFNSRDLAGLRKDMKMMYQRVREAAI